MRPPVVRVRADELEADRRRVRTELRQETERETAGRAQGQGPRDRRVRQGGNRLGHGPQVSSADVYVFVQSHGVRKLHGLLSGSLYRIIIVLLYVFYRVRSPAANRVCFSKKKPNFRERFPVVVSVIITHCLSSPTTITIDRNKPTPV